MMTPSGVCPNCNEEDESLLHCFRDCRKSLSWHIVFGVVIDRIWRTRNDWVFSQKHSPVQDSIFTIRNQVEWIVNNIKKPKNLLQHNSSSVMTNSGNGWQAPSAGKWKLNSDGSVKRNGRDAGCGGILRDCHGNLMFAYMYKLQGSTVVEAEIQGILHGLRLARNRGYLNLIIEIDCAEAFDLMMVQCPVDHPSFNCVREIKEIGKDCINCEWSLIGRELNCVADSLAKASHRIRELFVICDDIPDFLVQALAADCNGAVGPSLI